MYVLLKTDEGHALFISGLLVLVKKNYCITIQYSYTMGQIWPNLKNTNKSVL